MTTTALVLACRPASRSIAWLAVAGLLLARTVAAQPADASAAAIDKHIETAMAGSPASGASVAVVKDGKVVLARGYGFANAEKQVEATVGTVYQLGSMTKQFTATAILMLVEEGRISLDASVTDLLAGLPPAWRGVTVRHLLTHTSGIQNYLQVMRERKIPPERSFTAEELLALVTDTPLAFTPGEQFAYSNTGYYLLGLIIEKVSRRPYGDFVKARIFEPLGMTSSGYDDPADARPIRARGYWMVGDKREAAPHAHPSQPFAAGGLVSSIEDLVKWNAALDARRLLKPETYEAMWTPPRGKEGAVLPYGFGWIIDDLNGHPRHHHGGRVTGFTTNIVRLPADRLAVIVLTNDESGSLQRPLAHGIPELLAPALKPPSPPKP